MTNKCPPPQTFPFDGVLQASTSRPSRLQAFSLVELLTALSVFALLIVILGAVAQNVSNVWVMTQKRTSRQQSARVILDFITRDLQCALPPIVPNNTASLQMIHNPQKPPTSILNTKYGSGHTLFWQAPASVNTSQGDIAVLGYFIRWTPDHKANLCRLFVTPRDVNYYLIHQQPGKAWLSDTILDNMAPADNTNKYLGLMSENVVGLWFEPLDAYGQTISGDFNSRSGYTDSKGVSLPPGSLPRSIRVSIATIDARSAARLTQSLQAKANLAANADVFVASVLGDSTLKAIHGGVQAHTTSITLINSR